MKSLRSRKRGSVQLETAAVLALLGLGGAAGFVKLGTSFSHAIGDGVEAQGGAVQATLPSPVAMATSQQAALVRPAAMAFREAQIPALAARADAAVRQARVLHGADEFRVATVAMREVHGPVLSFLKDSLREGRARVPVRKAEDVDALAARLTELERARAISRADVFDAAMNTAAVLEDASDEARWLRQKFRDRWPTALAETGLILPFHGTEGLSARSLWAMRDLSNPPFEVPLLDASTSAPILARKDASRVLRDAMFGRTPWSEVGDDVRIVGKYVEAQVERLRVSDPEAAEAVLEAMTQYGDPAPSVAHIMLPFLRPVSSGVGRWAELDAARRRAAQIFTGEEGLGLLAELVLPTASNDARAAIVRGTGGPDRPGYRFRNVLERLTQRPWMAALHSGIAVPLAASDGVPLARRALVLNQAAAQFRAAKAVNPEAPGSVASKALRRTADSTLAGMHQRTLDHMTRVQATLDAFGPQDTLPTMLVRSRQLLRDLEAAMASSELSLDTLRLLAQLLVESTSPWPERPTTLVDDYAQAPWFPILEDPDSFWSYADVWRWRHAMPDAFPVGIPAGKKAIYEFPAMFFGHDIGHVTRAQTRLTGESAEIYGFLVERFDMLEKTHPRVAEELAIPLGNWTWESGLQGFAQEVFAPAGNAPIDSVRTLGELDPEGRRLVLSDDASTVLTAWAREWNDAHPAQAP